MCSHCRVLDLRDGVCEFKSFCGTKWKKFRLDIGYKYRAPNYPQPRTPNRPGRARKNPPPYSPAWSESPYIGSDPNQCYYSSPRLSQSESLRLQKSSSNETKDPSFYLKSLDFLPKEFTEASTITENSTGGKNSKKRKKRNSWRNRKKRKHGN